MPPKPLPMHPTDFQTSLQFGQDVNHERTSLFYAEVLTIMDKILLGLHTGKLDQRKLEGCTFKGDLSWIVTSEVSHAVVQNSQVNYEYWVCVNQKLYLLVFASSKMRIHSQQFKQWSSSAWSISTLYVPTSSSTAARMSMDVLVC
jgi:hypothetical protein